jgi:restriction endonuclease Mrr
MSFLRKKTMTKTNKNLEKKILTLYREEILETLKDLTPNEFEHFCAYLLRLYGCSKSIKTKQSNDGGIDFYGLLNPSSHNKTPIICLIRNIKILILGQAKKWNKNVDINSIKLLTKNFEDLTRNRNEKRKEISENFPKEEYQYFPLFITTSKFTKGAKKYANMNRIITKDGEQIIEDLIELLPKETITKLFSEDFKKEKFINWLKNEIRREN